jgi:hypothetical protein
MRSAAEAGGIVSFHRFNQASDDFRRHLAAPKPDACLPRTGVSMAFLNFSEAGFAAALRSDSVAPPAEQRLFSPLEWLVVALAQRDHLSSLRAPGRFARAAAALFGGQSERPLAGPRLEALRRVAVLARRRHGAVPASEMAAFYRAGFSVDQGAALLASIAAGNAKRSA